MNWVMIVALSSLFVAFIIWAVIKTNEPLIRKFVFNSEIKLKVLLAGVVVHLILVTHFLISIFAIPNNMVVYFCSNFQEH